MPELRKSPLSADILKENPIKPRIRNVVDLNLLAQEATLADKRTVRFDFNPLLNGCDKRKALVYKIANVLSKKLKDNKSVDTEYTSYTIFLQYCRYCEAIDVDPFSEQGFLKYCGKSGELQRRIKLANKPLPYVYLYPHGTELGLSERAASAARGYVVTNLKRSEMFSELWLRDTPILKSKSKPTPAYSQNEYSVLLRRLNFIFFSATSQLIASKEKEEPLESLEAVFDELNDGSIQTITLKNTAPKTGNVDITSPFNLAMLYGYYLFCHYTNLNQTSILNVCHPIVENEHKQAHRTTQYVSINAWKGRAKKVVQGTFVESEEPDEGEELPLEVDKRDGLTFINALAKLSRLYNPTPNNNHSPLFYLLTKDGKPTLITSLSLLRAAELLACYADSRIHHAPYLIERFYEVIDNKTITKVTKSKANVGLAVHKETSIIKPKAAKLWAVALAYGSLRALTDIPLKNIYMPLNYSAVDKEGKVLVSFNYSDGTSGKFRVESRYVAFLKKLEEFSNRYNSSKRSKYHPNGKLTPYLIPLGQKYGTYQWDTLEYPIADYLTKVGIYSGEYLLNVTAKRIRATASNNNFDPDDGGLSVATSLLQNQLGTLEDHYLAGDITQNQVIASQAIDILHEYAHNDSIEEAKAKVKESRSIEVLEYDAWLELRMPTNPNGMLCNGDPTGEAKSEHRASKRRAKGMVDENIELRCYQYDKCINCQSAKLVNDVTNAYKLLSFIELLEDSIDLMPEREEEFSKQANELMELAEQNLSKDVLEQAEDKLVTEGRYLLHNEDFLYSMAGVNYNA
ncbi:hypothetical protein [Pseudoalteromonas luteoviolacea]|uniref:Integrase n=1 Tax=Pseudoalteromonas luteoviolacea S4054 TaxID=1129367 RepID=A0A0F6AGU1_9GAMM|nr:hypothetical protein [Pseudoalteromonas luteoviolacea]AOT07148.1 hypothetical protein S4054249_04410 [Pseudoalteromonas luteoviolacea]AOT12065.1 hypothetical protein S40542_04410 [Pseudoalteromonas luteoviolacea]AOT16978.1 hypothetical protein S4054_04410 [Pseudoalteromonas luteoviolacea]KKE85435.1 hypothetical protein N479_05375 [Pseudoalteromonas luteoviolacea S4054]KZN73783.1 hypothetical protein N481_11785 [Pseudoalteromonas luteoviolacea S4047-1]